MSNIANELVRSKLKTLKPYESARRLFSMANASELETSWLNANENPFVPDISINPELYNRYPDFQPEPLLVNYASYCQLPPEQILATRGADEGIELLIRTFCEENDNILICPPTYGMYAISATTCGANVINVPTLDNFQLDVTNILAKLNEVKLIFICSPNNPTGQVVNREDILTVIEAAKDKALVIVDEAYIEFCPDESFQQELNNYENLVILRTLSKAFGLAGLRCGFTLANSEVINCLKKVIAPYPIPAPVAQIATNALSKQGLEWMQTKVTELNTLRAKFVATCKQIHFIKDVYPTDTNFVLLKLVDSVNAKDVMDICINNNLLLRNQSQQMNLDNTIRVSIGDESQMTALTKLLNQIDANLAAQLQEL